jgi:hypothetical protein
LKKFDVVVVVVVPMRERSRKRRRCACKCERRGLQVLATDRRRHGLAQDAMKMLGDAGKDRAWVNSSGKGQEGWIDGGWVNGGRFGRLDKDSRFGTK